MLYTGSHRPHMKDSSRTSVYCRQKGKYFENAIQNTISNSMPLISLFFLYVAIKKLHYTCHLHYFSAGWCSFRWISWLSSLGFKVRDLGWSLDPWTVLIMNTSQKVICALAGRKEQNDGLCRTFFSGWRCLSNSRCHLWNMSKIRKMMFVRRKVLEATKSCFVEIGLLTDTMPWVHSQEQPLMAVMRQW